MNQGTAGSDQHRHGKRAGHLLTRRARRRSASPLACSGSRIPFAVLVLCVMAATSWDVAAMTHRTRTANGIASQSKPKATRFVALRGGSAVPARLPCLC